ncbi:MAG TPA: hypothetical protein HPP77_03535 [Candidatus Hydrogenedentes bacterium]|nr:hypothetical protein [Candidatus Hydrogenedentota bacterium]HIJ74356.1 hypothetical protein [Candidatus Hydrogenedentota bacterium]
MKTWLIRGAVIILVITLLAVIRAGVLGAVCKRRTQYPGGLTFLGHSTGLFGTQYDRLAMWKSPTYTDPLPAMTLYIGGQPYPLASLTEDILASLSGMARHGNLLDAEGSILRYKFRGGRLTWISLEAAFSDPRREGRNVVSGTFQISVNDGPPFSLPVTHADLVRLCGRPEKSGWEIAN